jgi:transposase
MEDIIAVYELPYDEDYPVVCMDETSRQLIGEVHEPIACAPGRPARIDHEYVRNGVAEVFLEVEPLTGKRHVEATERRTKKDWAWWIKGMIDNRYPDAVRVRLVMDNLNTHGMASLYETFEPREARRLTERLEIHYTPKHGSWLNMAEIEISALSRQCLDRRIPDLKKMQGYIAAWENDRNNRQSKIHWHFFTDDARTKLKHLYPKL